jgi:hypothetical protein
MTLFSHIILNLVDELPGAGPALTPGCCQTTGP